MRLSLRAAWNGDPAPDGVGGEAALDRAQGALRWTWSVGLGGAPRVPDGPPDFRDGLWEHDVVELFLTTSPPDDPAPSYVEIEVGPAGHWLALAFRGVRRRDAELRDLAPSLVQSVDGRAWTGAATIDESRLASWLDAGAPLRGLACFVTRCDGDAVLACSQPLPGERADFHRPSAWSRLTSGRAASRGR